MIRPTDPEVIVIGGGPAGSATATILAQKGRRVTLLEKAPFPRYKVGESLMPYCWFTLDRLGVIPRMKQFGYREKYAVQFVSPNGKVSSPFYFSKHYRHHSAVTWHVERAGFDQMLLDHARSLGVHVLMPMAAREPIIEAGRVCGVRATDGEGKTHELRAPVTVDASGRDCFMLNRQDWRVPDPKLRKIAIWTYFQGVANETDDDEHCTTVAYVPEKGWFWYIPLSDGKVSVGIVAERDYLYRDGKDPEAIFMREVRNNDWIARRLLPARRDGDFRVTGDYSYRSRYCAMDGMVLVGDAFAFLDPVFSSGVFLALRTGELAADAIDEALRDDDVSAARFEPYADEVCRGIEAMRKLVYAFYDEGFSFKDLMMAHPQLRGDLTDCLIGDLFKNLDRLFGAVGEFAGMPQPLTHGRPLVATP